MSFHVDQVGVPVLVKVSYFPNWEVDGAEGPYRVAPNFMVVVPTQNDVRLHYGRCRLGHILLPAHVRRHRLLVVFRIRGDVDLDGRCPTGAGDAAVRRRRSDLVAPPMPSSRSVPADATPTRRGRRRGPGPSTSPTRRPATDAAGDRDSGAATACRRDASRPTGRSRGRRRPRIRAS